MHSDGQANRSAKKPVTNSKARNRQNEFNLQYANKLPANDILQNKDGILPGKLKIDRLWESATNDWYNLLVFGENLQFLKTVYLNQDPVIKDKIKGQVKLIYIDPPFATGEHYHANQGQVAYSAKRVGPDFIEFLRRRLIVARELLADDGVIVVRNAFNYGHYVKIIMDEVFSQEYFINEIIINRKRKSMGSLKKYEVVYEYLYIYSKSGRYFFENQWVKKPLAKIKWTSFLSQEERNPKERRVLGLTFLPPAGQHFSLTQEKTTRLLKEHYLRVKHKPSGAVFYYSETGNDERFYKTISTRGVNRFKYHDITTETEVYGVREIREIGKFQQAKTNEFKIEYLTRDQEKVTNDWRDIPSYTDTSGYPTENSEQLLTRIIKSFSRPGDLLMDFFAGSGTTAIVAEKLNRRWVAVDMGKLAYYTIQKRLLQIEKSKSPEQENKPYQKKSSSFLCCTLQNNTTFDSKGLDWLTYRIFAANLFGIDLNESTQTDQPFDGYLHGRPVIIFNFLENPSQKIDLQFLNRFKHPQALCLLAPESVFDFSTDSLLLNGQLFYFLKIPQTVLEKLPEIPPAKLQKAKGQKLIHDFDEMVGFHVVKTPLVQFEVQTSPPTIDLIVKDFKSLDQNSGKKQKVQGFAALAAIFIDSNYNGQVFRLEHCYFTEDLFPVLKEKKKSKAKIDQYFKDFENESLKISLPVQVKAGQTIMILFTDIYGNFYKETVTIQ